MTGPLNGLTVIELAGIGPAPYCGMLLADLGAEVILVERPNADTLFDTHHQLLRRGKKSIVVDLKHPSGIDVAHRLVEVSDAIIEGYRPGVLERLGLAPDTCAAINPALVVGRVTGWGQEGPLADTAGHDINFIALAGALHTVGAPDRLPSPPLNLLGDFAGGGLFLTLGVVSAVLEARQTGRGQVVDAAIVDGVASMSIMLHSMLAAGLWSDERGNNQLDGGAPYYGVYACADGRLVAVGAIEEQFYAALLEGLGLAGAILPDREDRRQWPRLRTLLQERFATRAAAEWEAVFSGTDACVTPILTPSEAPGHTHNRHRATFTTLDGAIHASPAPRFSRTTTEPPTSPPVRGHDTRVVLQRLGLTDDTIDDLDSEGVIAAR